MQDELSVKTQTISHARKDGYYLSETRDAENRKDERKINSNIRQEN